MKEFFHELHPLRNLDPLLFEISCGLNEMHVHVLRPHIPCKGFLHGGPEVLHTFPVPILAPIFHVGVDRARKDKLLVMSSHV